MLVFSKVPFIYHCQIDLETSGFEEAIDKYTDPPSNSLVLTIV